MTSLLDLPILVLENILKKLPAVDLLSFSLSSFQSTRIVQAARIRTQEHIHVIFDKNRVSIVFQEQNPRSLFRILISEDLPPPSRSLLYSSNYFKYHFFEQISSEHMIMAATSLNVRHPNYEVEKAVKSAISHVCKIFRKPLTRVTVNVDEVKEFSKLYIWDYLKGSCEDVLLDGSVMEHSELIKFMRKVKVTKGLAVDIPNIKNQPSHLPYRISKIQNLDVLILRAPWMDDFFFSKITGHFIHLENTRITNAGISKWLQRWMESEEKHFQVLIVNSQKDMNPFALLKDIEHENCSTDRNQKIGKFGSFTCGFGGEVRTVGIRIGSRRITRRDGSTATIDNRCGGYTIYMRYV